MPVTPMIQLSGKIDGGSDVTGTSALIEMGDFTHGSLIPEIVSGSPTFTLEASIDGTKWAVIGSNFSEDEPQNLCPDGQRFPKYRIKHTGGGAAITYHVHRWSVR